MKKIILNAIFVFVSIILFSFSSILVKTLELVNGTNYPISEMWITKSTSSSWDYEVEMDKTVAPKEELSITLVDELIKNEFDVIIYDAKSKKYHEYDGFKPGDLTTTWNLLGDEVDPGKHGQNPAPTK
jgi:hypothetical protein